MNYLNLSNIYVGSNIASNNLYLTSNTLIDFSLYNSNNNFLYSSNISNNVFINYYDKTYLNTQFNNFVYNQEQLNDRITLTSNDLVILLYITLISTPILL